MNIYALFCRTKELKINTLNNENIRLKTIFSRTQNEASVLTYMI